MKIINQISHLNYNLIEYDIVDSTMILAKKFPENTIVIARKQKSGRGKGDRVWESEDNNNLYFSMNVKSDKKKLDYSQLSFLASVAMRQAISAIQTSQPSNIRASIVSKWPNDILINEKKACGILLEMDCANQMLIIGVGVNIDAFPSGTLFKATSLKQEGIITDRYSLLKEFLNNFNFLLKEWIEVGFSSIRDKWISACYRLNQEIEVDCQRGIFRDLDKNGTLILELENGKKIMVKSGDVF